MVDETYFSDQIVIGRRELWEVNQLNSLAPFASGGLIMSITDERKCPDCGCVVLDIKIVTREATYRTQSTFLKYTVPEAKRSIWTGAYPIEGDIVAYMCDSCGRVLLYGHPQES